MIELRPIRTEADYDAVLTEVERLWGAPFGTVDGDRLDVVATLIDAIRSAWSSRVSVARISKA